MTNKDMAELFGELAALMELHGENDFKIRAYSGAYLTIKKQDRPLEDMSRDELSLVPGLGKSVAEKIIELNQTGRMEALEKYRGLTPKGVIEMFRIKGVGPKKIRVFWKEMGLESVGELLYACRENRLIAYKGFGPKIQEDIIQNIEYLYSQYGYFLYAKIRPIADELLVELRQLNPGTRIDITGELRRALPVIQCIDLVCDAIPSACPNDLQTVKSDPDGTSAIYRHDIPVRYHLYDKDFYSAGLIESTGGSEAFLRYLGTTKPESKMSTEEEIFEILGKAYVPPVCRDLDQFEHLDYHKLIREEHIKGVVHAHSTWSDGICDLRTLAITCQQAGYRYLVISDHSRSAAYANGLSAERVEMQWREIDALNKELGDFFIFKGIESDILSDGSLDYPEDILSGFDLVIASIHSHLAMNEETAMKRLIRAIENPYTRILGHPTGRLLLSRKGYPVDHRKIIDCCSANGVAIELNANPVRLDLDWKWIPYAQERGVMISINPDAHNLKGINDIRYGVLAARKGGLTVENCLNAMDMEDFKRWQNVKNQD